MKIAISSTGKDLDSQVEPRFGRSPYFLIVDPETMEYEAFENTSANAAGGAGIASAQLIAQKGASVLLTGICGPNAMDTLQAAKIKIITGVSGTVRNAIEDYKAGKLSSNPLPSNPSFNYNPMGRGPGRHGACRGRGMGRWGNR